MTEKRADSSGPLSEARTELLIKEHFTKVRSRIPAFYHDHLCSFSSIVIRHWRCRKDIPGDLLALPRLLIGALRGLLGRWGLVRHPPDPVVLSCKERKMLQLLEQDLLQLGSLQSRLQQTLSAQTAVPVQSGATLSDTQQPSLIQWQRKLSHPRDGIRDLLVFMLVGILGKTLVPQVIFGSAIATGIALVSGLYLYYQTWWQALWFSVAGLPAWVSITGGLMGLLSALLLTPVLAPFAEYLVNRWRGEPFLLDMVNGIEKQTLSVRMDGTDLAGHLAGLSPVVPDLFLLFRGS